MADYTITLARSARKELERLPEEMAERMLEKIEALSRNARPAGTIQVARAKESVAVARR